MTTAKPIILVDQDGPLADFDKYFFEMCATHGYVIDCEPEDQTHRFLDRHIPDKGQRTAARDMVNNTRWFRHLPVVPGAVEGINALAEVADVWICTKPLEANPNCRDDKAWWVRHHLGEEWEHRLIITPDKSRVYGHLLLDDAIRPEWVPRATWGPVVYPTTWNSDELPLEARWSWTEPVDDLLGLLWWTRERVYA